MNDRFTERVRKVLFIARDEAGQMQHDYIGTEHLLLGIIKEAEGIAAHAVTTSIRKRKIIHEEIEDSAQTSDLSEEGEES